MKLALLFVLAFSHQSFASFEGWAGDNGTRLKKFIEENSKRVADRKYIAVFDWDNTVIKNDIGDAVMFWMVNKGLVKKPRSWKETSPYLSEDALKSLEGTCGKLPNPLPTNKNADCADAILSIYSDGKTVDGKEAWAKTFDADTMEPAYAWTVQLSAGYKPAEIAKVAEEVIKFNLANEIGTKQKIGTKEYSASIRIYPQIQELIKALQVSGFDVWVSSASSQYIVEPFAKRVGVTKSHVIGVRPALDVSGRITHNFEACNSTEEGASLINYRLGKRCWINKIVFKVTDFKKLVEPSPIDFAAGDSDTDVFFVKDARQLRLAINRNKSELMCNAYANADGKWMINPMFIEPKSQRASDYSCSKFGLKDQKDLVF